MNAIPQPATTVPNASYGETRFNALLHGLLSRYAVLPWEDRAEYQSLVDALVAEHLPQGPTEEHLVEELAGIIWRKRRVQLAEAAVYRERLRKDATSRFDPDQIAGAALLPLTGKRKMKADVPQALAATSAETARDLRDVKRQQAITCKAMTNLASGEPDAYAQVLETAREDIRSYWLECLENPPADGLRYEPTAEALMAWIRRHWAQWYDGPIAELEHRDAIREQAIGSAYTGQRLEVTARYEVHLDRKLERTLAMLIRLRDLRRPALPG
jgi:hypothetical protein